MPVPDFTSTTPLFIVFNAASGSGDKRRNQADMAKVLDAAGRQHEFLLIQRPDQIDALAKRAADAAVERNGAVIVAGGDGTINAVAAAALPTGRPFGIVPQGTFNYSGRAHQIPLATIPATQALLTGHIKPIQVGKVNERIFLVNASLGLYPQLLQDREAYKQQYGRKRIVAVWAGIRTMLRYRGQLTLEIEHDRQHERVRTPTLFVGNNPLQLEQVGLPEAQAVQHRQLGALILKPVSGWSMLWLGVCGALGKLGEADNVRDFAFATMTVRSRNSKVVKVATDGEILRMRSPLQFSVAPQPLMLIVPGGVTQP